MKTMTLIVLFLQLVCCGFVQSPKISVGISKGVQYDNANIISKNLLLKTDSTITFDLDSAFAYPKKIIHLIIYPIYDKPYTFQYSDLHHLPTQLGTLLNLKILEIHCLEKLEDLPVEIGQLKKLERLIINNGNGCVMNIKLPNSIGQLQNLKELTLYGALDAAYFIRQDSIEKTKNPLSVVKYLPNELSNLKNLEVLDLGRNGINYFPPQIEHLIHLKSLLFEYSQIKAIPAFISNLHELHELDLSKNGHVKFPDSMKQMKNLKIKLGDNGLTLKEQQELKDRFPNIIFDFENEYFGGNEEPIL
jgi:Leucine-rich repeat (LRR) protein